MPATLGEWYVVKKNSNNDPVWGKQSVLSDVGCGAFADSSRSSNGNPGDINNSANRTELGLNIGGASFDLPYLYNAGPSFETPNHYCSFNDFVFTTTQTVTRDVSFIFRKYAAGEIYLGFEYFVNPPRPPNLIRDHARGALYTRSIGTPPVENHDKFFWRASAASSGNSNVTTPSTPGQKFPNKNTSEEEIKNSAEEKAVPIPIPTRWQMVRFRITHPTQTSMKIVMAVGEFQGANTTSFYDPTSWIYTGRNGSGSTTLQISPGNTYVPVISFGKAAGHQLHGLMINQF